MGTKYCKFQLLVYIPPVLTSLLQFDGQTTYKLPLNEGPFDPKNSRRLLFSTSGTATTTVNSASEMAHLDNIVNNLLKLQPAAGNQYSTMPPPREPTPPTLSPTKNTPSKLYRFLVHAQESLGVSNATGYEVELASKGYGPDILSLVNEKDLVGCGITPGDAIRLKCGTSKWWMSPEVKRAKKAQGPAPTSKAMVDEFPIWFERCFHNGGSASVFGSHVIPGECRPSQDWDWWYYNQVMKTMERVPEGHVPVLDPEYQDNSEDRD